MISRLVRHPAAPTAAPTPAPTAAPTPSPTPAPTPAPVVQAVHTGSIEADNRQFAGADGAALGAIAGRLTGGDPALAGVLQVRPGVEIRSTGALTLQDDWNLLSFDPQGQAVARPGGAPMVLTLRAAGNLNLTHSLSDGFRSGVSIDDNGEAPVPPAQQAAAVRRDSHIVGGEGASLRLVGGADLAAAQVLQTRLLQGQTDSSGNVLIGRSNAQSSGSGGSGADVLVRTTTGRIDIAAARDLQLLNRAAVVYTTGLPQAAASSGLSLPSAGALLPGAAGRQSPYLAGGGAISLQAGQDVVGGSDGASQYGTDWWWRSANTTTGSLNWWSRYDLFSQGFATFGGGDIAAQAGRDARQLALSTAASGGVPAGTAQGQTPAVVQFGGGNLRLAVARDLADGFVFAGGALAQISAGRAVQASAGQNGLQLLHLDTQVDIRARNDLALGRVAAAGLVAPLSRQGSLATNGLLLAGMTPTATLAALSSAGTLRYSGQQPEALTGNYAQRSVGESLIPSSARLAAPQGRLLINGNLVQAPVLGADLMLLAGADLQVSGLAITGSLPELARPFAASGTTLQELLTPFTNNGTATEQGSRAPVRLIAQSGDLAFDSVQALNPVRLVAGGDVVGRALSVQHQQATELTLLQAGGDVRLNANTGDASFSLKVQGPGDLVVLAGRDVALGSSGGIGSVGNLENVALPAGGAEITVVAGVALGSADLAVARARYVQLLGGAGLASQPGALYAQLAALQAGQPLPAPDGAAAGAFDTLPLDERIARTTALLGEARLATLAAQFLAERDLGAVTAADALTVLAAQNGAVRSSFIGHALADAWLGAVPVAAQPAQALALAALPVAAPVDAGADGAADPRPPYTARLLQFVQQRTGQALDGAAALQAYAALPAETQWLLMQQVLFDELRSAGRSAASSDGVTREAAYERGFSALMAVFPGSRASGAIRMTSSQIKTQQGGALRLLAPGGGINAGETFTGSADKPAAAVGIVTVAGGNVEMAVRDSVIVNQSRVFTVGRGDVLIWASRGDIDAGRGAKTVTGAPPPLYKIDGNGNVVVDTSGSFAGSGIAVLDSASTLDLFAPSGEINAGDAGIQSKGNANLAAERLVGADAIAVQGSTSSNLPPPAVNAAAAVTPPTTTASSAAANLTGQDDDDPRKKRRRRLILDFLGFSQGD